MPTRNIVLTVSRLKEILNRIPDDSEIVVQLTESEQIELFDLIEKDIYYDPIENILYL